MPIRKLTDSLYIAPQLTEADVQEAVRLGIQTVICNRLDGEEENQPAFAEVQNWFKEAGINQFSHQPVVAPQINAADVAAFQNLLQQSPAPILAFCRTGTRCSLLWGYHQVQHGASVAEVVAAAEQAGVNLKRADVYLNPVDDDFYRVVGARPEEDLRAPSLPRAWIMACARARDERLVTPRRASELTLGVLSGGESR